MKPMQPAVICFTLLAGCRGMSCRGGSDTSSPDTAVVDDSGHTGDSAASTDSNGGTGDSTSSHAPDVQAALGIVCPYALPHDSNPSDAYWGASGDPRSEVNAPPGFVSEPTPASQLPLIAPAVCCAESIMGRVTDEEVVIYWVQGPTSAGANTCTIDLAVVSGPLAISATKRCTVPIPWKRPPEWMYQDQLADFRELPKGCQTIPSSKLIDDLVYGPAPTVPVP